MPKFHHPNKHVPWPTHLTKTKHTTPRLSSLHLPSSHFIYNSVLQLFFSLFLCGNFSFNYNLPLRKLVHSFFHASLSGSCPSKFAFTSSANDSYMGKLQIHSSESKVLCFNQGWGLIQEKMIGCGVELTTIRFRWRRRSSKWVSMSLLYSGWPWIPMMWSSYLNISIPVLSDHAITSASGGSSRTYHITIGCKTLELYYPTGKTIWSDVMSFIFYHTNLVSMALDHR